MGSGRWVFLVMLAAAGAAVGLHRGSRERITAAFTDARLFLIESRADRVYRRAEREFQSADFERAELTCSKALKLDPSHVPVRALYMEVQFLLGRGRVAPAPVDYGPYMWPQAPIRHTQMRVEIDNALERADRWMLRGEADAAERELRKILEYAKWLPCGVEINERTDRARLGLALLEAEIHFSP